MANYNIRYLDNNGRFITLIKDWASLEYSKVSGDVGVCAVTVPNFGTAYTQIAPDRRVTVDRGGVGYEFYGFVRDWEFTTDRDGRNMVTLIAYDLNHLLTRRVIAYYAGAAQTKVTGNADDLMKEIVRDNFVDNADYSGTPTNARDIDDYGFSVAADTSQGPSLTKEFAWTNVLDTLQDLQADSKASGTEVFFGVYPTSPTNFVFNTAINQPGRDLTRARSAPLAQLFSFESGNLLNPVVRHVYSEEITSLYAGGRGQNGARVIQLSEDTTRIRSNFGRFEGFVETGEELNAPTLAAARVELGKHRPRVTLEAQLLSTEGTPYASYGWQMGDKVTVYYAGQVFDVIIRSVHVRVDSNGKETIRAKVESE